MANDLISNMSYTSRDFNNIYPELLDLVKKITYKWDPSITNESDPGIILLKLNALIADKCNYNIDKNVLECFPLSVTQEANARQLYEQLGYYMKWYRSATTKVSLTWIDFDNYVPNSTDYVIIPKFTMVSDSDNSIVYTLLGLSTSELNSASNSKLYLNGESLVLNAIQGVAVSYEINGSKTIQVTDLDENNRLYFSESDIAENGIFITNIDQENFASWVRKDNLATENLGNTYYSFGVLPGTEVCYIEFPEDAPNLFRNGISVVYIRTMGKDGNIPIRRLEKFYNDITTESNIETERTIALNSNKVEIINIESGNGGEERETLDEAYRGYRHTVGTFNTLITLRDYINAIINGPDLVSNVIVTDRTDDIQCSYKIMSSINNISTLVNKVDKHNDETTLNAYNIKLYALQYASATIDNLFDYNKSFDLLNDNELSPIKDYIQSQKAIPHDFTSIRTPEQEVSFELLKEEPYDWYYNTSFYWEYVPNPLDPEEYIWQNVPDGTPFEPNKYYQYVGQFKSHYCIFRYLYPIRCRITPTRTLDDTEKAEVKESIRKALYDKLNSKRLDFGESLSDHELEQIIEESSESISSASILESVKTVSAVYWNGKRFVTVDLSESSEERPYLYYYSDPKFKNVTASDEFMAKVGYKLWGLYTFKRMQTSEDQYWAMASIEGNDGESSYVKLTNPAAYFDLNVSWIFLNKCDWFSIEINPVDRIKDEVFVKSVLQGVTPLFIKDSDFNFDINQIQKEGVIENVAVIRHNVNMDITPATPYYTLRNNESVRFTTANLLNGSEYGNYVKYYFVSGEQGLQILSGSNRILKQNEYMFFFYKEVDDNSVPYEYEVYSEGNIICPDGFTLTPDASTINNTVLSEIASNLVTVGADTNYPRKYGTSKTYRGLKSDENNFVSNLRNWLTSNSKKVTLKYVNSVEIPDNYSCYWVLNNKVIVESENESSYDKYVLFEDYSDVPEFNSGLNYTVGDKVLYIVRNNDTVTEADYYMCKENVSAGSFDKTKWIKLPATEYTLDTGEYFFYRSSADSELNILGEGTRIQRSYETNTEWSVRATSLDKINNSSDVLNTLWFTIPEGYYINITEQQYVTLGEGATILFQYSSTTPKPNFNINSNEDTLITGVDNIWYTFNKLDPSQAIQPGNYSDKLPDLTNIDNWRARTTLALSLGKEEEQILLSGQTLDLYNADGSLITTIVGQDEANSNYPQVIQSYLPIESVSFSNSIVTYELDEEDEIQYNKIYNYSKLKNVVEPGRNRIIYSDTGGAIVFFPVDDYTETPYDIELEFNIPAVNDANNEGYLLSIYNPHEGLEHALLTASLGVEISEGVYSYQILYPIGTKTEYNLNKQGTYYFKLPNTIGEGMNSLKLSLSGVQIFEEVTLTVNHLYRYHKPLDDEGKDTFMSDETFNRYFDLLAELDTDRQYQYDYQTIESNEIKNPLDPESFLNAHHIYNSFTIFQHDTGKSKEEFKIDSLR